MEQIKAAFRRIELSRSKLGLRLLSAALLLGIGYLILASHGPLAYAAVLLAYAAASACLLRRACSEQVLHNAMLKAFKAPDDAALFFQTIDRELEDDNCIEYVSKYDCASLFVTKRWFVFASAGNSIIARKNTIVSVSTELIPSESEHALVVAFSDGETFASPCDDCDIITELLHSEKREYDE